MRPILHPALSRTWRDESTVQVGATPGIALVVGGLSRPERAVVEAMTGAADLAALRELAAELGLGRSAADRLTRLLLAAGAVIDGDRLDPGHAAQLAGSTGSAGAGRPVGAAGSAGPAGSPDPWRQPDRSSAGLVTRSADGGVEALASRGRLRVDVHGAGRIGAQIARLLAAAGIGTVAILDGDPVRPADVSPGGHPRHAVGMPRRRSLASLLAADAGEDDWDELGLRAAALDNAAPSRRGGSRTRSRTAGQEVRPAARPRIGVTAGERDATGAQARPAPRARPVAPALPTADAIPARRAAPREPAEPEPQAHRTAEPQPHADATAEPGSAAPAHPGVAGGSAPHAYRTAEPQPHADATAEPQPHADATAEPGPAAPAHPGAPAGSPPAARRTAQLHSSARIAPKALPPQRPAGPRTPSVPDLAILAPTAGTGREEAAELLQQGIPHLFATVIELTGVVGPLVIPGRSSCLRCHDLHRTGRDPHWPLVLDQALRRPPPEPACDSALAAVVAGLAAAQALAYLDGFAPAAVDGTVEVTLPSGLPRRRSWRPHPRCGCGWAAGAGEAAQWVM